MAAGGGAIYAVFKGYVKCDNPMLVKTTRKLLQPAFISGVKKTGIYIHTYTHTHMSSFIA
jgi:hypothetical protein